jgi:lipopolysaccharide/colanic/teichoic acid biosynthesis glycosyltransferase
LGDTATTLTLADFIHNNPQLGYALHSHITTPIEPEKIHNLLLKNQISVVVIPENLTAHASLAKTLTDAVVHGVEVHSEIVFYEHIMRQIPLSSVTPAWFFDVAFSSPTLYDQFKRGVELIAACLLQVLIFPIELFIVIIIFITSPGSVLYSQLRVGRHNKIFRLYKFRTMRIDAEKNGAQWSTGANDPRATFIGKLLRYTHLDELPQLFNVIRGEVSFVGPRPERPEIIEKIAPEVPFYHMRHMVSPGITGWAQINFKKDQTIEDVKTKLQYDLYYIEHRSFLFDIAIIIRTIKSFFINT